MAGFSSDAARSFRMTAQSSTNSRGRPNLITRGSLRPGLGVEPDSISRTMRTIKLLLIIKTMIPSACNGLILRIPLRQPIESCFP